MVQANEQLRAARSACSSPRNPAEALSRTELAELVAAEVYRRTGREAPVDAHYIAKLERGAIRWPGREYREALRHVLDAPTDNTLGLAPPAGRADGDALLDLIARAEASDVTPSVLDTLDVVTDELARAYTTTPAQSLLDEVQTHARQIGGLLAGRALLAQRRRLLVAGGWLALLAATIYVDLGARRNAAVARTVAASLERETGHGELGAWAVEIDTWTALVDQDWQRAAGLAAVGENVAPANTGAAVQLAAQSARAAARLGDGPAVRAALDRAAHRIATQPSDRPSDHHFAFDARKLDHYVATALAWLGDPAGERRAREIVEQYPPAGAPRRLATARLDLGLIMAREQRPDEAAELGILAVDSDRLVPSNMWRAVELDEALARHRDVGEVAELHERLSDLSA